MDKNKRISKQLSYILRHHPESIDIQLDSQGWANVNELLQNFSKQYYELNLADLESVVENNDKKRFAFNEDKSKIRASQGHSIEIELGYKAQIPPAILYHGTATRFLESIQNQGLIKGERHHVHLSANIETAQNVGSRHGKPVVLEVKAQTMHEKGFEFFISDNGVWLTDAVPTEYLIFP